MVLSGCIAGRNFHPRLVRQQAAEGGSGRPPSLMDDVRRVIMGRNNLDMTTKEFVLHRDTELQRHTAARIREYEAMLTVIGYLTGKVPPPPPLTTEGLRAQISQAIKDSAGSLINRSKRSFADNFNPLNAITSGIGALYGVSGAVADVLGFDETANLYYDTAKTSLDTDVVALYSNAVNDLLASIWQGLSDYWMTFWKTADTEGFLIAYGKLRIDAGFLAAELAIDIALGAVTSGAGAAASRVIRIVGRRVGSSLTRVTVKIGKVGEVIPDTHRVLQLDVDDAKIPADIERLMDEDNLGGASTLSDTDRRATPLPATPSTTYVRGRNTAAIEYDPKTKRPISGKATIRDDFGSSARGDDATEIGQAFGRPGDQGGHIFAHRFFGDVPREGIVPQAGNLNTGAWKTMENEWADWIAYGKSNGKQIEIDVGVQIIPPGSARPDRFRGQYRVYEIRPDGSRVQLRHSPIDMRNEAGQTFKRVYFRTDPDGKMRVKE